MIPYGKQDISDEDINAVVDVLKSDYITQGPRIIEFEQTIADYCQAKFAVATNSATSALHVACLSLGVTTGDIVWTSPISFVASANCALYCGAIVDFIDIDIDSGNISLTALEKKLQIAKQQNKLPKVIILVHLAGQSCLMAQIKELTQPYNIRLIEDASHAIGAKYKNKPVGNGQYSDICIFSFHPVKIITSAEGGMALTNDAELDKKLRLYRSHGVITDSESMTEASHGPWYYQQVALGFNYRMTELQAALGLSQAKRIDDFVAQRNQKAQRYDQAFGDTSLAILRPHDDNYSAYHLYVVLLPRQISEQKKAIVSKLREMNICAHVHYIPIHTQPYYQQLGFKKGSFPVAEEYYQRAISLPLYPNLTATEQEYIIGSVISLL